MNGKGSKQRPTNLKKYGAGWGRVFGNNSECRHCDRKGSDWVNCPDCGSVVVSNISGKFIHKQSDLPNEFKQIADELWRDMFAKPDKKE